jgi:hypothetical protein
MFHRRWLIASTLAVAGIGLAAALIVRSHSRLPETAIVPVGNRSIPAPPPELTLPKSEREYLWEIEHHGNVLNRYGFGAFATALRGADANALMALLASDFTGAILQEPRTVHVKNDLAQLTRLEGTGAGQRVDREQFIAYLLDLRRRFAQPPHVKLALMALSPSQRDQMSAAWSGTCQLRMWGEASPGQPAEVVLYLEYRLPQPTRERLEKKGWLHECRVTQSQVAQAPRYLLRDVTAERGIDAGRFHDNWRNSKEPLSAVTGGVYLCDYNRDGILDMLITDIKGYVLYRGLPGGKFKDVTLDMGLLGIIPSGSGPTTLAAFADLDGDGWEDLILADHVYRNEAGQRFSDVTRRTNLVLPHDASAIAVADFDRDGRLDLYVTRHGQAKVDSWIEGRSGSADGNYLWRNLGNWQFQDVTKRSGAGGDRRSSFTAIWFDADNDGWPDLYVPNEFGNGVLLRNQGDGTFKEITISSGAGDFGTMGLTCGDIDNDGHIDLYSANMYSKAGNRVIGNLRPDAYSPEVMARLRGLVAGSQLYLNRGGRFEPVGKKYQVAAIGWAYGAALVDLDNDGWLDLYATCGYVSQSRDEPDG